MIGVYNLRDATAKTDDAKESLHAAAMKSGVGVVRGGFSGQGRTRVRQVRR